jgi:hypothetical protein
MAFYSGVVPPVKTQIQGSLNIPFAQTVTTGRQIVEGASGALALQTTAIDINSKLNKLEIMDTRLGQLVVNSDTIENQVFLISDYTSATNSLLTTSNTFSNASAVNSGFISANTGTTATNTGTTATNTATTNTTLATTNTTLTTANNLATLSNWIQQKTIFTAVASITFQNFAGGAMTNTLDLYVASPIAPFTPTYYYNTITIMGDITGTLPASPQLRFQFSNDNQRWITDTQNPSFYTTTFFTTSNQFNMQKTNLAFRYARVISLATFTTTNYWVSLSRV